MKKMKIEYKINSSRTYKKRNDDGTFENLTFSAKAVNKLLGFISECILAYGTDGNGYVDIPIKKIKNIKNGYYIVQSLLRDGLLERSYYNVEKKKAYGYRFSEQLKEQLEIQQLHIEPKDILADEIIPKDSKFNLNIDPNIMDRLRDDFYSIDFSGDYVEKEYDEWGNYIDISKWISNNMKYRKWMNGHISWTWSSNRLYTNFTQLSSKARTTNIKLSGESLVEFDISSSFPLMLCLYSIRMNPEIINDYDFKSFSTDVLTGKFYSKLQWGLNSVRNCGKEGEYEENEDGERSECDYSTRLISRNETKTLFQIFLNDKTKKNAYINGVSVDIKGYMKTKYRSVYDIVEKMNKDKNKSYDYLVAVESNFIFKIIKDLYSTYEDIKILTCHDAIYVPESFIEETTIIWEKWMKKIKKTLPKLQDDFIKDLDLSIGGVLFSY